MASVPGVVAAPREGIADSGVGNAEMSGDRVEAGAVGAQRDGGVEVPSGRTDEQVSADVLPLRENLEVGERVVEPVAVDVVDDLAGGQRTSQSSLDDQSVLESLPANTIDDNADQPVAGAVAGESADMTAGAGASQGEVPAAPLPADDTAAIADSGSAVEAAAVESAAHPSNDIPEPTPAQHAAGNFKAGHIKLHGLDVTIQVPKGGMRRGTDRKGKAWERPASDHYGHIRGTDGGDGEPHDVYLGPNSEAPDAKVFVIRQVKPGTDAFDENKAMVGYATGAAARKAYQANFPKGLKVFGGITEMTLDEFKASIKKPAESPDVRPDRDTGVAPVRSVGEASATGADGEGAPGQARTAAAPRKVAKRGGAAPAAEAPPPETTDTAADDDPGRIEDFGERLEGARKFLPPSLKEELGDDQIATQPLSKLWPADAHVRIEDPASSALAFAARAEIPAKPRTAHKVRRWVEQVKMLRGLPAMLDGAASLDALEQSATRLGMRLEGFFAKVRLLAELPRESWALVDRVAEYPGAVRYEDGKKISVPFSTATVGGKTLNFDVGRIGLDEIQQIKDAIAGAEPSAAGLTAADFEIRTWRNRPESFIQRKGDSERRQLRTFNGEDSAKQARAFLKEEGSVAALEQAWEAVKARDNVGKGDTRRDQNRERVGEDRRGGRDVTEKMFADAFGFRGVQFGNWVRQGAGAKDRQGLLNEAYDALLDLSDLVGIPPRAISLNGKLGLALGARGSGRASAHFERDNLVVNLTKTKGAGSLAHEWFHALDNYFSRLRGSTSAAPREGDYITYKPEPAFVPAPGRRGVPQTAAQLRTRLQSMGTWDAGKSLDENASAAGWQRDPNHPQGARPEVEREFAALVEALNASPMSARSASMGGTGASNYWHRIIERGARGFENYVISKLSQRGWTNDFLANVRGWEDWQKLGKNRDRYPYLFPEEEAPIIAAFDSLFDTIETRTDEAGNVAMFDRPLAPEDIRTGEAADRHNSMIADAVRSAVAGWGSNGPRVRVLDTSEDLPAAAKRAEPVRYRTARGFYDGRTIYLVAPNLRSAAEARSTVDHEGIGHYGLDRIIDDHVPGGWARLTADIQALREDPSRASPRMRDALAEVERRYPNADADTFARELPAVMVEKGVRNGILDRVVAAVRAFLRSIYPALRFSHVDIHALLRESEGFIRAPDGALEQRQAAVRAMAFDLAPKTDTAPFKKWFGTSKAVDAKGAPRVVHHGTAEDFTVFADTAAGSATQHATSPLGHFFTENRELAQRYAENASDGRPADERVIDAYLSIQKPYTMTLREAQSIETPAAARARKAALQAEGFDGIHIPEAGSWVVFESGQAKATDNRGTFDRANPDIRFSLPEQPFSQQVRTAIEGKFQRGALLHLGRTPAVLRMLGYRDLPLRMSPDVVQKLASGKGGARPALTERQIAKLPEYIDEPLAVLRSKTRADSLVVITTARDGTGAPIAATIAMDRSDAGRPQFEIHVLTSAYGKAVPGWLDDEAEAGRMLYYDPQKEAPGNRVSSGVTMNRSAEPGNPRLEGASVRSGEDLRKFRAEARAAATARFSLPAAPEEQEQSAAFRNWFGDSKVVDAQGSPQVVYHGTAGDFETFDPARRGRSTLHGTAQLGEFFSVSPEVASDFVPTSPDYDTPPYTGRKMRSGGNVMPVYLSIQNPYLGLHPEEFQSMVARNDRNESAELRRRLEAEGHDGIFIRASDSGEFEFRADTWVSFRPEQIKSATGNRGTFDPGDARIQFSMPAASVDTLDEVLQQPDEGAFARAKAWLRGKAEDLRPAALGALQRRHLTELMEDTPQLRGFGKQYDDRVQQMETDRNQLITGAPDAGEDAGNMLKRGASVIAEELRKFTFVKGPAGWMGRRRPEAKVLADLMHDATLEGIDPSEPFKPATIKDSKGDDIEATPKNVQARIKEIRGQMRGRPGDDKRAMMEEIKHLTATPKRNRHKAALYPELVARWQQLSPKAQELYRNVRDWYAQMSDATQAAFEEKIRAMGQDLTAGGAGDIARRYTNQTIAMLRAELESARVEGVYFPLNRDGDFWISFTDADGESGYKMFESAEEAASAEKKLRAAGFKIDAQGRRDGNYRAKDAPSGTFIAKVIGQLKKSGAPDSVQDEVYQTFLRTLPELSMRKHAIHRKKVPGFSDDVLRAFSKNAFHGAYQLARLRHSYHMQSIVDGAVKRLDNDRKGDTGKDRALEIARADALLGELRRRHDFIMSPKDSVLANHANAVGFAYFMGASPAAALVNLTQNAQVTLPVLAAEHGWPKATRVLGAALRDTLRTFGNIDRTLTDPIERQAYNVLRKRGDIDKTQTHTLAGLAEGNLLQSSPAWAKTMEAIGFLFHRAEVINREAAGMAAFRLARSAGKTFDEAVDYAGGIITGTHFDYSAANRPRYMQGNVARVALQFKNYSVGMTWALYRNLYQAVKGETPETRRIARRTLTGILGMTSLLAGTMGLPLINAVRYTANAAHLLFGDEDEPWDFNTEFRAWLADQLGEDAATWVADGAVNRSGVAISSRVGLADLWFRESDRDLEGRDAYFNLIDSVAGPMGGLTKNLFVGLEQVRDGHVWRGVETMLPKATKDAMKGLRLASEGANSLRGDPIVADVSAPEAFVQALGFSPTRLFEQQRENRALKNYEQHILDRRQSLMNAYALAVRAGQDTDTALTRIHAFNRAYPEIPLTAQSIRQSLRARARYSAEADSGVGLNKRIAGRVREAVGVQP